MDKPLEKPLSEIPITKEGLGNEHHYRHSFASFLCYLETISSHSSFNVVVENLRDRLEEADKILWIVFGSGIE